MLAEMDPRSGKRVLEIGCGTGYVSYHIAKNSDMEVIGSDLCKPFIEEARKGFCCWLRARVCLSRDVRR